MSRSRAPLSPAVHCCSSRVTSDGADAIPPCPGRKPAPTEREELPPSIGVRREAGKLTRAVSLHESVPPRREEGRLFTRSRRLYVAVPFSHVAFARVQRSRVRACAYTPGRMSHQSSSMFQPSPVRQEGLSDRRFPGADVIRTLHGGVRIRIISGLVGDGEPLYVVDGAPATVRTGQGLDWLRPEDIARIDVLKDPSETSIYGPRGVHGVILITTKRNP